MNKAGLIAILITLFSCGVIRAPEYANLFGNLIFGADNLKIDEEFYNSQKFSFAKVSIGRNRVAIVTLGFVKENSLEWFTKTQAGFFTQNGKIISLVEFPHDFRAEIANNLIFNRKTAQSNSIDLYLKDPDGFFMQDTLLKFERDEEIKYLDDYINVELYSESVKTYGLKWSFANKYWVDPSTGMVLKAEQSVHPRLPKINIEYYYKYD